MARSRPRAPGSGKALSSRYACRSPPPATRWSHADFALWTTTGRRVLIVDDNRDAADSLCSLVTTLGSEAKVAYDGASALSVMESYRPTLVIMDVGMPGLAGDTVARTMRTRSSALIVALTGWGGTAEMQVRADAFDRVVTKPIDVVGLRQLLSDAPAEERAR